MAVTASSVIASAIFKHGGPDALIKFPIYTTSVSVPGYTILASTFLIAAVICYWVEIAEAHEGGAIPRTMTPPTKEVRMKRGEKGRCLKDNVYRFVVL